MVREEKMHLNDIQGQKCRVARDTLSCHSFVSEILVLKRTWRLAIYYVVHVLVCLLFIIISSNVYQFNEINKYQKLSCRYENVNWQYISGLILLGHERSHNIVSTFCKVLRHRMYCIAKMYNANILFTKTVHQEEHSLHLLNCHSKYTLQKK